MDPNLEDTTMEDGQTSLNVLDSNQNNDQEITNFEVQSFQESEQISNQIYENIKFEHDQDPVEIKYSTELVEKNAQRPEEIPMQSSEQIPEEKGDIMQMDHSEMDSAAVSSGGVQSQELLSIATESVMSDVIKEENTVTPLEQGANIYPLVLMANVYNSHDETNNTLSMAETIPSNTETISSNTCLSSDEIIKDIKISNLESISNNLNVNTQELTVDSEYVQLPNTADFIQDNNNATLSSDNVEGAQCDTIGMPLSENLNEIDVKQEELISVYESKNSAEEENSKDSKESEILSREDDYSKDSKESEILSREEDYSKDSKDSEDMISSNIDFRSKLSEGPNDQNEFLTTCELKASVEDESSRDSIIDGADKDKKDAKVITPAEEDFVWEKYLEDTESISVPPTTFKHVEYSLESGFVKGMKLEVPNKCNTDTYWVASVLMTCGPLLRLRFDGYEEDNSADFWCDLMTSEIHPIGWCAQNNQILQPPEAIKDKFEDWRDFLVRSLTGARTAPSYLLDKNTGMTPMDQLKQGMRLELQHPIKPKEVWLVKIIENVGGRLYLRFEGVEEATHDFWLFYLNHRLHPIGWAKSAGFKYKPPNELQTKDDKIDWEEILKTALKEAENTNLPAAIFKDQEEIHNHRFHETWKLEALNPIDRNQICPATIVDVVNEQYIIVEIDDLVAGKDYERIRFSCHAGSKCIFPPKWCESKGIPITPPKGWPNITFTWKRYLDYCFADSAPLTCFPQKKYDHEFEQGMKLEVVNPENPNQICVATISKVIEPLIWIHLDNSPFIGTSHIEHFESHNLFPVGWCESNGYQLKTPIAGANKKKKTAVVLPKISDATTEAYQMNRGGAWCPKVYYNHQCFSGPYLSKGRIASLPKSIGPGPICLVMKEAISMLINVAYKPCRVLKELQLEGKPNPDMYQQTLKAKYKGKSYRAVVEICQNAENLAEFCKKICTKLECCPNLISATFINGNCPENCSQLTKTKYTYYNPKKKIGRPPGGHTNLENGPKKPGKKKKKKRINILSPGETNGDENGSVDGDEDKESVASDTRTNESGDLNDNTDRGIKRKYVHHVPMPSDIKTRGAKLPKYSFEKKTHKKIPIEEKQYQQQLKQKKQQSKHENTSSDKKTIRLSSNPLHWTVKEVVNFIKGTECAPIARLFLEQEIDGQALLLLTLPTVQEYLELKLGPAVKLCHHVEQLKSAFFEQYAK